MLVSNRNFLFQGSPIFRGYVVSFREGYIKNTNSNTAYFTSYNHHCSIASPFPSPSNLDAVRAALSTPQVGWIKHCQTPAVTSSGIENLWWPIIWSPKLDPKLSVTTPQFSESPRCGVWNRNLMCYDCEAGDLMLVRLSPLLHGYKHQLIQEESTQHSPPNSCSSQTLAEPGYPTLRLHMA